MFLKNRNIISKIKRSKVTDYAALRVIFQYFSMQIQVSRTFQENPLYSSTFEACAYSPVCVLMCFFRSPLIQNPKIKRIQCLTLRGPETPKWVPWQTVRTQMKYHTMRHFIKVYTVQIQSSEKEIQYFLKL